MVQGPYAVMAAGVDPLILAVRELVRLLALNHAKAVKPVRAIKIIDEIIRAFRGDKYLPGEKLHAFAARTEIIHVIAAEHIPVDGSRRREPGVNIDINAIRAGERNIKLRARDIGFAKRRGDVRVGDGFVNNRALGEQIVP